MEGTEAAQNAREGPLAARFALHEAADEAGATADGAEAMAELLLSLGLVAP